MAYHETVTAAATGAKAKAAGGAAAVFAGLDVATGKGLDVAAGVLDGIFGGMPWEMSPGEIVNAVTGGASGAFEAVTGSTGTIIDVTVAVI